MLNFEMFRENVDFTGFEEFWGSVLVGNGVAKMAEKVDFTWFVRSQHRSEMGVWVDSRFLSCVWME